MKKCLRLKISKAFCCNNEFNKKALCIKHSWDEVEAIICKVNKCSRCKKECDRK